VFLEFSNFGKVVQLNQKLTDTFLRGFLERYRC
jgi:hypothetical protein